MSGMFKEKKYTPDYEIKYDPFKDLRGKTANWMSGQIGKEAPQYSGQMIAPKTGLESSGEDWLKKYAEGGQSEGMGLANEEIKKTMSGYYDPSSSPYYQAVKAESMRNLEDTKAGIASDAAGGGRYWGGARLEQQQEAGTDVANSLNTLLGSMAEKERMNRLNTAPLAAQLGQYEENQPLAKSQALMQGGGLDRTLNQAQNEAVYNEWLRATQDYPMQMGQLASPFALQEPIMAQSGYKPSAWSKYVQPLLVAAAGGSKSAGSSTAGG